MRRSPASILLLLFAAASCPAQAMEVKVQRRGELIVIDVEATTPGSPRVAWSVLTDHGDMATFISNLTTRRIVERRDEHHPEVMRAGWTKVGFMSFGFEAVRAVARATRRRPRSRRRRRQHASSTTANTSPSRGCRR